MSELLKPVSLKSVFSEVTVEVFERIQDSDKCLLAKQSKGL